MKRNLLIIETEIDVQDENLQNELMDYDMAIMRADDGYVVLKDKTGEYNKNISIKEANAIINSGLYIVDYFGEWNGTY